MTERLSGNLQERLRELREEHGYKSRNKLADVIGVDRTTYGRIENGSTKTINSDILISLATLYDVSTDYILGLSNTPEKMYDDIKVLGLSVEAAQNLSSGKVDSRVINELLLNKKFAVATKLLAGYYSGIANKTYEEKNKMLDFNQAMIESMVADGRLPDNQEIRNLSGRIKVQKESTTPVELEKIKNTFMAAVKEIKEKIITEVSEASQVSVLEADFIDEFKKQMDYERLANSKTDDEKAEYIANILANAIASTSEMSNEQIGNLAEGYKMLLKAMNENLNGQKD